MRARNGFLLVYTYLVTDRKSLFSKSYKGVPCWAEIGNSVNAISGLRFHSGKTWGAALSNIKKNADGLRQATTATMYSVDAPVWNIMGQQVGKSHKGLVVYKGRKYLNR